MFFFYPDSKWASFLKQILLLTLLQTTVMAAPRFQILLLVALATFPTSTLQWCYNDEEFQQEMSKEGYSWCTPQYDLLYVKVFQRTQGNDDLRDFRKVKCCQPPEIHLEKPSTCTSVDRDTSFSRCVATAVAFVMRHRCF